MEETTFVTVKDPDIKKIRTSCGTCRGKPIHTRLTEVEKAVDFGDVQGWSTYCTIQCDGCGQLSFQVEHKDSENWNHDEVGNRILITTEERFPELLAGPPPLEDRVSIPPIVEDIYLETHAALYTSKPILAGIGLRAIVEAVCSERNATGRTLEIRINELVDLSLLTQSGAEILHKIRLLGNRSAHESDPNSPPELIAAFMVVEHLLQTVYVIPHAARNLK